MAVHSCKHADVWGLVVDGLREGAVVGGAVSRPAESCGAFVVVPAVSSEWFTVHDPPQRGHPSYPPQSVDDGVFAP